MNLHHVASLVADAYTSSSSDRESGNEEPVDLSKQEVRATASSERGKPHAACIDDSACKPRVESARNPATMRSAAKLRHGGNLNPGKSRPSASGLPPDLVRELERARKKGRGKSVGVVPDFIEVDASFSSTPTAEAAQQALSEGERHRNRHLAAHSLRKAGVSKAARRNHHITELMAAARAEKIVEDAQSRLG